MSYEIIIPKLGFSMTEGTLAEWLAADGAAVAEGDPLFALEADKATEEVAAPASGTLRIHAQAGQIYVVGTVIGIIE
jgi:pyruvate/2-oxoglutarate dehydrogenase complex dihydrolipoamide acyltransferase (E2) component